MQWIRNYYICIVFKFIMLQNTSYANFNDDALRARTTDATDRFESESS